LIKAVKTVVSGINKQTTPQKLAILETVVVTPLKRGFLATTNIALMSFRIRLLQAMNGVKEWQERKE
jgi:hypothetical protein